MKLKNLRKSAAATLLAVSAAAAVVTPAVTFATQSVMAEDSKSNEISIRFNDKSITVKVTKEGITIAETLKADLEKGKSIALNGIEKLKNLLSDKITITTDAPDIVSIKDGVVTALKEGTANIIAKAKDGTEKVIAQINVTAQDIKDKIDVTKIKLDETKISLTEGLSKKINAIIEPINATDKTINWSTDNPAVAKVVDGVVTAISEGTAKIKASTPDGKQVAELIVEVVKKLTNTGWKNQDGKYYYYKNNVAYTGWHWMTEKEGEKTPHWSYFGNDGVLRTGWQQLGVGTANPDGNNVAHWSYFGDNGWLRTGWNQLGVGTANPDGTNPAHWSYFGDNGWLRTFWQQLGKGTANPDGNNPAHWSYFGANGWLRTYWQQLGKGTSNPDNNNPAHWSYFGGNGWLRLEWQLMGNGTGNPDNGNPMHTSYFGLNGWLRTGRQTIDGKSFLFDTRGWLQK